MEDAETEENYINGKVCIKNFSLLRLFPHNEGDIIGKDTKVIFQCSIKKTFREIHEE